MATEWERDFFLSMHRVDLCKKKLKKIEIFIETYIDPDNGNLVIHGHDLGEKVEEIFGKSDYEYWRTVPSEQKENVLTLLRSMTPSDRLKRLETMYKYPDIILIRLVKEHFSSDQAVSKFEEWCERHGIQYESYSF
ncbi:MAG TPA: hypothetical protein PL004_05730 [Bacillota bacterium]|nr:hypothetical protein [Bacillota bacterium]